MAQAEHIRFQMPIEFLEGSRLHIAFIPIAQEIDRAIGCLQYGGCGIGTAARRS